MAGGTAASPWASRTNGQPDRRHRRAKTETEVKRKVRELEDLRDKGRAPKAGRKPTVEPFRVQ